MERKWASAFDELKVTIEEIIENAGDHAVVVAHHQGRGRASGVAVECALLRGLYVARRQESQWRVDEYTELAEALEAAGLRE